ncbi:Uncharacterised protein [Streptococcus pneumoniae]|nr:Uncharacterised protein [Streptococcus pneumoniae]
MLKDLNIERQLDEVAATKNYPEISNERYIDDIYQTFINHDAIIMIDEQSQHKTLIRREDVFKYLSGIKGDNTHA